MTDKSFDQTGLTFKQKEALQMVAEKYEWDKLSIREVGILLWCAFHYYVERLGASHDL